MWTHLGRAPFDPTLWRELMIIFLPGGELICAKNYGRRALDNGPAAAAMSFRCEDPWNRWSSTYDGAAIVSDRAALERSLLTDAVRVRAGFSFTWEALSPVWEMGEEMRKQSWGHLHYEQLCTVTGTVHHRGEEIAFNGHGLRDHTRGPRDFAPVERHCWLYGVFPSGKGFVVIDVTTGPRMSRGMILDPDGSITEATVESAPLLTKRDEADEDWELRLRTDAGPAVITGQIQANWPGGFGLPSEVLFGFDPGYASHALFEGWSRLEWDGEIGHGLTERTIKLP